MKCEVCNQEYGLAHNCAGVAVAQMSQEEAAPPPAGFAPLYYLRLAYNIALWDDMSIRRASRDSKASLYGWFVFAITVGLISMALILPQYLRTIQVSASVTIGVLIIGFIVALVIFGVGTVIQLGLCHLIAKFLFNATGTFVGILRPLLLAWFVNALIIIPIVGLWATGVAWTAILMLVFEEIEGIGRLQAFFISAGVNLCFIGLLAIGMRR